MIDLTTLMLHDFVMNTQTTQPAQVVGLVIKNDKSSALLSDGTVTDGSDIDPVPIDEQWLQLNSFLPIDSDKRFIKYVCTVDAFHDLCLIYDKMRDYYSYTEIGSSIPVRFLHTLQRLLKLRGLKDQAAKLKCK